MKRFRRDSLLFGYALAVYLFAALFVPYFLCFAGGRAIGPALRRDASAAVGRYEVGVDVALFVMFALSHSLMARPWFKGWVQRILPAAAVRSTYVLCTCATLTALVALWSPLPPHVWEATDPFARALSDLLFGCGFVLTYAATLSLGHTELLGLAAAWRSFAGLPEPPAALHRHGPYRWIRHPLMVGLLFVFWSAPSMTGDRLLFAVAMTAYAALGTRLEERDLLALHREEFRRYRGSVPAVLPRSRDAIDDRSGRHRRTHSVRIAGGARDRGTDHAAHARPASTPFDFESAHEVFWYDLSVFKTVVLDAYTAISPPLERFIADRTSAVLPRVEDPELANRARRLIGDETAHAAQHERSMAILVAQGFDVAPLKRSVWAVLSRVFEPLLTRAAEPILGPAFGLAVVAGLEHWTTLLAEMNLAPDGGHHTASEMNRLFSWHATQELEHRSVAFDLFGAFSHSETMRLMGFLVASVVFATASAIGSAVLLAQVRRLTPRTVLRDAASFFLTRERVLVRGAGHFAAYLRPGFHPERPNAPHRTRAWA
jgi:predicted metal-dependent hydrolase/protein-S-isoprenylcysteine O-methyltransferase Ste14